MVDKVTDLPKNRKGAKAPPPPGSDIPVKKNCGVTQTIFQFSCKNYRDMTMHCAQWRQHEQSKLYVVDDV